MPNNGTPPTSGIVLPLKASPTNLASAESVGFVSIRGDVAREIAERMALAVEFGEKGSPVSIVLMVKIPDGGSAPSLVGAALYGYKEDL